MAVVVGKEGEDGDEGYGQHEDDFPADCLHYIYYADAPIPIIDG